MSNLALALILQGCLDNCDSKDVETELYETIKHELKQFKEVATQGKDFTDREYILLFANHLNSETGADEKDYFKTPEEAIEWMDKTIKNEWLDPDELLLRKGDEQ